jgi:hypothetical protein
MRDRPPLVLQELARVFFQEILVLILLILGQIFPGDNQLQAEITAPRKTCKYSLLWSHGCEGGTESRKSKPPGSADNQ